MERRTPLARKTPLKATSRCAAAGCLNPVERGRQFCSVVCRNRAMSARRWRDHPKPKPKSCPVCRDEFTPNTPMQRYCSKGCAASAANAARKRTTTIRCVVCRVEVDSGPPSRTRKTCGAEACRAEMIRRGKLGSKNPNWKGDQRGVDRWKTARGEPCVVCGSTRRVQLHHVVYEQHVRAAGGDPYDPCDALSLCLEHHVQHHKSFDARLPLALLRDENFAFARELLGAGKAYEYLKRHYTGTDPRLDALIDDAEAA